MFKKIIQRGYTEEGLYIEITAIQLFGITVYYREFTDAIENKQWIESQQMVALQTQGANDKKIGFEVKSAVDEKENEK